MYRSDEYTSWRKHAMWAIAAQAKGRKIPGQYTLEIVAVKPDKRRRDIGNLEKAVSDILQATGIIEDDCLCQDLRLRWAETGAECSISVSRYETEQK